MNIFNENQEILVQKHIFLKIIRITLYILINNKIKFQVIVNAN